MPEARKILSELDGGKGLVERVSRTGIETDLLTGDDGDGARLGQRLEQRTLGILLSQSFDETGSAFRRKIEIAGWGRKKGAVRSG